jgi:hypothetical protein
MRQYANLSSTFTSELAQGLLVGVVSYTTYEDLSVIHLNQNVCCFLKILFTHTFFLLSMLLESDNRYKATNTHVAKGVSMWHEYRDKTFFLQKSTYY